MFYEMKVDEQINVRFLIRIRKIPFLNGTKWALCFQIYKYLLMLTNCARVPYIRPSAHIICKSKFVFDFMFSLMIIFSALIFDMIFIVFGTLDRDKIYIL